MELEQLKDMWKQQEPAKEAADIRPLLGRNSNLPIERMKRHLLIELVAVVVLYGLLVIYFINSNRFVMLAWLYFLTGLAFCIYFFKKFRLLNSMQCMACEVKSNLSKQVGTLEKYIRFYLIAGTALVPVILVFYFLFQYYHMPGSNIFFRMPSEQISIVQSITQLLVVCGVSTFLMYFVNRWYVDKLYGRYVKQLKNMLHQMEEGEGEEQDLQ